MIRISVTELRKRLFEILDRVAKGETVVIERNRKDVARLSGIEESDWRANMSEHPQILVSDEELMAPMEDIWEGYI